MQTIQREFNRKSHGLLPVALLFFFVFLSPGLLRSQAGVGRAYLYPYPRLVDQQIVHCPTLPPLKPWRVTAHAGDPIRIDIFVDAWPKNAYPGIELNPHGPETVTLPISLDTNVIHNISLVMDPDSVGLDSLAKAQFESISGIFSNGRLIVTIFGRSYFGVQGGVCRLTCTANLALGEHTVISLGPCPVTLNDTPFFVADSLPSVVNIGLIEGCGDSLLLRFMSGQLPLTLDGIVPNPSHDGVALYYSLAGKESVAVNLVLEDALGRTWVRRSLPMDPGTGKVLTIDLAGIPSGVYLIRVAVPGGSASRRLIKE